MSPVMAGRAYVSVEYDPKSITKLRSTTAAEGKRMASSWSKTAGSLKSVGSSLTRNVTLPLVAVGAVSIKVAADFDASLSKIQGLVGASSTQMDQYRKSILALAPAVAQGPTALADALYFVTSSGFKGAQALDILTVSAKAATAGLGETQTIADLVTSAITAYGPATLSAAQATDILVAATKAGKGDPAEFAAALQENVAAADTLGISFDQLAAATAALSTVNSDVAQDATQLSGIMQAIIKPGTEAVKVLHKVGLSAADLRKEVADKGLLTTLLDLKDRFHDNVKEIGKLFPNVRGLRGFLTLVGSAAKRNVSIFDQVAHSTGDLNRAFKEALTSNPQVQFQRLTAQLQVLAIVIGNQLIPIGLKLTGWLVDVANKFKGLSSGQQTFLLIALGTTAALGPLLTVMANVSTATIGLAKGFQLLTGSMTLAEAGAAGIGGAFAIIAVAAVGAAYGISHANDTSFDTKDAFTSATTAVTGLTQAFRDQQNTLSAHKNALLQEKAAALGVKDASKALSDYLQGGGKKGSLEYRHLLLNQAQAAQNLSDATTNVKTTQQDSLHAANVYKQEIGHIQDKINKTTGAYKFILTQMDKFKSNASQDKQIVQDYADKMNKLAGQEAAAARGLRALGDEAGARLASKLAASARQAALLAQALQNIPKKLDIYITTHSLNEGGRSAAHSAAGQTNWRGGSTWVGEQGPEIVNLPRGSQVIPHNTSMRMTNDAATGGDIYLSAYIGAEALDPHLLRVVRSENQQTARRVKAGRRSTA